MRYWDVMTKNRRLRQIKKGIGIFWRRYPWQIHFQYETLESGAIKDVVKCLLGWAPLRDGRYIPEYEKRFKEVIHPEGFAYSFGSGRMALFAILEAMGIGTGDEVILPAFTCEVVVNALLYRKIKPVYADIEPVTFNLDAAKLEGLITPKTRAIVAQHTFGVPCRVDEIKRIAERHGLYVIEDCALSLGSSYMGKSLGTYGDAAIFSTDRTKITSTLMGGMAFTMDRGLAEKIEDVYRRTGFLSAYQTFNIGLQVILMYLLMSPFTYYWGQVFFLLGWKAGLLFWLRDDRKNLRLPRDHPYPCRLSNLQALLGLKEIERLGENLKLRKDTVGRYVSILRENMVPLNYAEEDIENITLRFSLLLKDREAFVSRWMKYFDVGQWFDSPAPGWYEDLGRIGYVPGSCPAAEFVHGHIVNFPTHQRSETIRRFLYKIISTIRPGDVVDMSEKRPL